MPSKDGIAVTNTSELTKDARAYRRSMAARDVVGYRLSRLARSLFGIEASGIYLRVSDNPRGHKERSTLSPRPQVSTG